MPSIIMLIPKKPNAAAPGDFRPITMVHSFAKLLSKLLATRLAPRLNGMISKNQSAFIKGRTIHDNFKYVKQAAALLRKKKIPAMLLKLDISKDFDTVSWPFMLDTMRAFGFSEGWRRWVALLLSSASCRLLLSGYPGEDHRPR